MPVDGYCERTGPEFWSEPVNAWTNLAFLVAAWFAWREVRRRGAPACVTALVLVLVAIGLGSFTFHTVATRWAVWFDTVPIAAFMLTYVVVFAKLFLGAPWRWAWLGIPLFIGFAVLVNLVLGGGSYLPALLAMVVLAAVLVARGQRVDAVWFLGIAVLFGVSLAFRTIDQWDCRDFPLGTHFVWHLLNSVVLFLLIRVAASRAAGNRVADRG
ncbi:ceramidase domain-containing protein [Actinokineospora enzanensis]|uniref:ceramidase domain-containing protein n=1 Tax=Actinokineospora enzanensis TaxID=155975 RepID=UPI000378EF76|nr:ceramidase domain-containing protein [Actinokineospora enzanensis]